MAAPAPPEAPYYPIYGDYDGRMPRFYDASELPFAVAVEAAWPEIRRELEGVLHAGAAPFRPNWDPYDCRVSGWKSANLFTYTRAYPEVLARFPVTAGVLARIPHVTSAFVNVLEPRTRIPSHCGDSNTTWRCHLPLVVPREAERCGIEVGGERRSWREGRLLAFCDAHRHHAWNDSDEPRVVLVFDVMRPEYVAHERRICGRVLGGIALMLAMTRLPALRKLPHALLRPVHAALGALFALRLPVGGLSAARSGTAGSLPAR